MEHLITFRNGEQICTLGQGTWNMGKIASLRVEEIKALHTGIDLGMTLIDTAEMYDNEEMIGEAVRDCRDKVFLVSKVLPQNAAYQAMKHACERSLRKLRTDRIDLYLLHWKGSYPFEETVRAMLELREEGKILRWGVSNMDVTDMERFFAIPDGESCAVNQILYNLKERGVEYDLLPWCAENNVLVMAYSPVGEGTLAESKALMEIADRHDATPTQIALAWVMHRPGIIAIPKAGKVAHVRENYRSLFIELTGEDYRILDVIFPAPKHKLPLAGW